MTTVEDRLRRHLLALITAVIAARRKLAAHRTVIWVRRRTPDGFERLILTLVQHGNGTEQRRRIRMSRIFQHISCAAALNDAAHIHDGNVIGQLAYPYLTVSILNPTKGEIDSVRMKIGDIISRSCRSTNPNLRNTEPHIWVDGKAPQWYACCPGSRDYTLLANATAEYLSVFELTHERVQNRQHTQKMKGADAHAR